MFLLKLEVFGRKFWLANVASVAGSWQQGRGERGGGGGAGRGICGDRICLFYVVRLVVCVCMFECFVCAIVFVCLVDLIVGLCLYVSVDRILCYTAAGVRHPSGEEDMWRFLLYL